ncbi:insulin-like peptide receptor [Folsomia candida]|uniref:insulin-like peptide receptor n=1 Tax=Folsomia candida TaxID=158441 RepID=UPI001605215C|nr:insulin-like peptide receptor [Folsomia candida]
MFHKICVSVTSLFINFAVTSFSTNLTPRENGFLPPYVNRYCTSYFSSDFVHYGCCDKKFPESHCFLNDWGTRDAVCETQNLQANRFNFTCSNSILDHNCTVPKGTFFCCSKDAPLRPDNRPIRPVPDSRVCGTMTTDRFQQFGPGNLTVLDVAEHHEWGESHFIGISAVLKAGTNYVNVTSANCIVSICYTDSEWDANCLHFHYGSSMYNGIFSDNEFGRVTTSISCGCLANPSASEECTFGDADSDNGTDLITSSCSNRPMDADTCALLYQEWGCESCFYQEIRLTTSNFTFKPTNYAVIRSLRVNSGCSIRASSIMGFQDFNATSSIIPEFFKTIHPTNGPHAAQFNSFDCTCGPKTVTDEVGMSAGTIAGIAVLSVIAVSIVAFVLLRRRNQKVKFTKKETDALKVELFGDGVEPDVEGSQDTNTDLTNTKVEVDYSLKKQNIAVYKNQFLGKGNYSVVYKGVLTSGSDSAVVDCAIKTVDEKTARIDDLKLLMNEIRIMSVIGRHANIVSFLGYYCNFHPSKWEFLCLTELCLGNLHERLRLAKNSIVHKSSSSVAAQLQKAGYVYYEDSTDLEKSNDNVPDNGDTNKTVTTQDMRRWCGEIADGMDYLISKNLLHIDLATRNILLSTEQTAKISDFGLSKKLYESLYYKKVQGGNMWLPMKWSAFESLMSLKFSSQSEIWSYAVTVWEIFSFGDEPYPEVCDMVDLIRLLNSGDRLDCPKRCDQETYELMKRCWEIDENQRPSFVEMSIFFKSANE